MKRTDGDVMGRPRLRELTRDVAGSTATSNASDVASFRLVRDASTTYASGVVGLIADFEDFLVGGAQIEAGVLPLPDPQFRERLRRRLWRTHVMTRLRDGGDTH